jgi:hypothetical protein
MGPRTACSGAIPKTWGRGVGRHQAQAPTTPPTSTPNPSFHPASSGMGGGAGHRAPHPVGAYPSHPGYHPSPYGDHPSVAGGMEYSVPMALPSASRGPWSYGPNSGNCHWQISHHSSGHSLSALPPSQHPGGPGGSWGHAPTTMPPPYSQLPYYYSEQPNGHHLYHHPGSLGVGGGGWGGGGGGGSWVPNRPDFHYPSSLDMGGGAEWGYPPRPPPAQGSQGPSGPSHPDPAPWAASSRFRRDSEEGGEALPPSTGAGAAPSPREPPTTASGETKASSDRSRAATTKPAQHQAAVGAPHTGTCDCTNVWDRLLKKCDLVWHVVGCGHVRGMRAR